MAEENPHIEIKRIVKPIDDTREQYLFENENLILGRPGFIFRSYPTLKERLQQSLQEQKEYNFNISKISRNTSFGKLATKNILNNNINNNNSSRNNNQLIKSKSQANIISQPILRFKNRTDLERICDTIQQYVKPSEQEKIKEIRARHVHSIDFPRGILYKGGFKELKNLKKLQKNSITNNINFQDDTKGFDVDNKNKPIIFFTRLQRLNVEAKKLRSNLHLKTHFKGVESVFINPKQIYDTVKKDENLNQKNIGNYAYNENYEKEEIEKRNEYKEDMRNLLKEEKEKENIINTREFNNYLNNKVYYNDPVIKSSIENKKNEEDKIKQIKNMNYLKKIAFEDDNLKSANRSNDSGNINTDSSNDGNSKNKKNANFENEHQLRIGGKIFHMQNEMGLIAKEILNKCKFYTPKCVNKK
jgi:hypothetical protein